MTERERNWRSIQEATCSYDAPNHLSDYQLRCIASALCAGVAPVCEDQDAMGPLPIDPIEPDP